jgi:hypothetical protein
MTKSTSATTMSPACASVPEWAEKIFSAMVFPMGTSLLDRGYRCPSGLSAAVGVPV